jgi:cytochrome c2
MSEAARARDDSVARGRALYAEQGCYGWHRIAGAGTPIGPDLSTGGRRWDPERRRRWLIDPRRQRPTTHMPRIGMSKADARALAAHLATLR